MPREASLWRGRSICVNLRTEQSVSYHRDVIRDHATYTTKPSSIITDIQSIQAVVGRVHSRTKWTIIDRSIALSHAAFKVDEMDNADDESDNDLL
jgi:hypothetical protein